MDIKDIDGRVRVWDKSATKDLKVTVPAATSASLEDGSIVYYGLRARVALSGTGFRMKAVGWDVEGTLRRRPATRRPREGARSTRPTSRTCGPVSTRGSRVLLQPVAAK